jgi:hypothetical protein
MADSIADTKGDDLARWAEPLIFDCLVEHYFGLEAWGLKDTAGLVHFHGQMWQAILRGERTHSEELRDKLMQVVDRALLPKDIVEQADKIVLSELLMVVSSRYRRSRRLTRTCCNALDQAVRYLRAHGRALPPPTPEQLPAAVPLRVLSIVDRLKREHRPRPGAMPQAAHA